MPDPFAESLRFVGRSLWLCFFPIFSAVAGLTVLLAVPQGTEVFQSITDLGDEQVPEGASRAIGYWLAFAGWGLANWYASRVLLMRKFRGHDEAETPFILGWRKWFPRGLAVVPMAWITAFMLNSDAPGFLYLGLWCLGATTLVAAFIWGRRALLRKLTGRPSRQATDTDSMLPQGDIVALSLALALSGAIFLGLSVSNYWFARFLGAPAILMLSLASITLGASILLIFWPLSRGWPALTWLPLLLYLALPSLGLNRNHVISDRAEARANPAPTDNRPDVFSHFKEWLRAAESRHHGPIFLVAIAGGASRSGWWAGHTLGALDDLTQGEFAERTFAISGISGGSLGAAAHVALLARRHDQAPDRLPAPSQIDFPNQKDCEALLGGTGASAPLSVQSECFLGRDFLSTTVGYLLFPDLAQRFVPIAIESWDRSLGLETPWRNDWLALFGNDRFGQPLQELYRAPDKGLSELRTDIPIVLLNTAGAHSGMPILQAPVKIDSREMVDYYGTSTCTPGARWPQGLTQSLAAVVHNSARFPVVSPGGEVRFAGCTGWDVLVDGGYFENSGAFALFHMLRAIEDGYRKANDTKAWIAIRNRLHVIFITNDVPPRGGPRESSRIALEEVMTPVLGLYSMRSSRGDSASRDLVAYLGVQEGQRSFSIPLDETDVVNKQPSMNWYLTPKSRQVMWSSISREGSAKQALCRIADLFAADCGVLARFREPSQAR